MVQHSKSLRMSLPVSRNKRTDGLNISEVTRTHFWKIFELENLSFSWISFKHTSHITIKPPPPSPPQVPIQIHPHPYIQPHPHTHTHTFLFCSSCPLFFPSSSATLSWHSDRSPKVCVTFFFRSLMEYCSVPFTVFSCNGVNPCCGLVPLVCWTTPCMFVCHFGYFHLLLLITVLLLSLISLQSSPVIL